MSNWSSRIRAERERQNLTREQVVQRMLQFLPDSEKAVTTRTLMAWEAGEREPRVTVGLALALALGVENMTDLYLDSEPKLNRTGQQRLGRVSFDAFAYSRICGTAGTHHCVCCRYTCSLHQPVRASGWMMMPQN